METNEETVHVMAPPVTRPNHVSPIRAILGPSLLNSSPPKTFTSNKHSVVLATPLEKSAPVEPERPHRFQVEVLSHNTPGEIYIKILKQQKVLDT